MATLIAHLVIGDRVSAATRRLRSDPSVYGAFLLGSLLVDADKHSNLERHQTHLVKLSRREGGDAPRRSCASFLRRRDSLLLRAWNRLTEPEQAFVAGYLCHLAADEAWLDVSWQLLSDLGLQSWNELPIPAGVMVVVFNTLSQDLFEDLPAIASALDCTPIPDVFAHVPHSVFQGMWDIARVYVLDGGGLESYLTLLEGQGRTQTVIQTVRQQSDEQWREATVLVQEAGGIEEFIHPAVERAVRMVPQLWADPLSIHRT
jgi:hypothetical protein